MSETPNLDEAETARKAAAKAAAAETLSLDTCGWRECSALPETVIRTEPPGGLLTLRAACPDHTREALSERIEIEDRTHEPSKRVDDLDDVERLAMVVMHNDMAVWCEWIDGVLRTGGEMPPFRFDPESGEIDDYSDDNR